LLLLLLLDLGEEAIEIGKVRPSPWTPVTLLPISLTAAARSRRP